MAVMALINIWAMHVSYTVNSIPKVTRCSVLDLNMNTLMSVISCCPQGNTRQSAVNMCKHDNSTSKHC